MCTALGVNGWSKGDWRGRKRASGQGVKGRVRVAFKKIPTIRLYIDLSESNNKDRNLNIQSNIFSSCPGKW